RNATACASPLRRTCGSRRTRPPRRRPPSRRAPRSLRANRRDRAARAPAAPGPEGSPAFRSGHCKRRAAGARLLLFSACVQDVQLAVPGRTCWRTERAERLAFLVDGAQYFAALARALERAERRILIVGWDFHGRTRLRPDAPVDELPDEIGPRLRALLERKPGLCVHVLEWNYSLLYAVERRLAPWLDSNWCRHERFAFRLDDQHPFGASQHQKLVAIDDALAFTGGLDLT